MKNVNVNLLYGLKIKIVKLGEKNKHVLFKRDASEEDTKELKEKNEKQ